MQQKCNFARGTARSQISQILQKVNVSHVNRIPELSYKKCSKKVGLKDFKPNINLSVRVQQIYWLS